MSSECKGTVAVHWPIRLIVASDSLSVSAGEENLAATTANWQISAQVTVAFP